MTICRLVWRMACWHLYAASALLASQALAAPTTYKISIDPLGSEVVWQNWAWGYERESYEMSGTFEMTITENTISFDAIDVTVDGREFWWFRSDNASFFPQIEGMFPFHEPLDQWWNGVSLQVPPDYDRYDPFYDITAVFDGDTMFMSWSFWPSADDAGDYQFTITGHVIPEPGSSAMTAIGFLALVCGQMRQRMIGRHNVGG